MCDVHCIHEVIVWSFYPPSTCPIPLFHVLIWEKSFSDGWWMMKRHTLMQDCHRLWKILGSFPSSTENSWHSETQKEKAKYDGNIFLQTFSFCEQLQTEQSAHGEGQMVVAESDWLEQAAFSYKVKHCEWTTVLWFTVGHLRLLSLFIEQSSTQLKHWMKGT